MMYHLFLLAVLFTASECWVLRVSDQLVSKIITTNVSLECVYDWYDNGLPKLENVYEILIFKSVNNQWVKIAEISSPGSKITSSLVDVKDVKGHLGTISNSYLQINFPTATTLTIGKFKCDVAGYGQTVHTDTVDIKERAITFDDILDIIDDMKKNSINSLQTKVKSNIKAIIRNSNQISSLSEDVSLLKKEITVKCGECEPKVETSTKLLNQINNVNKNLLKLKEEVAKQMKMIEDNKSILKNNPSKVWPAGTYGILKPKADCPFSPFFDWAKGSIRISTDKRVSNSDEISQPSNMAGTVLQHDGLTGDNSVNMELCVKRIQDQGPAWPAGHYCIQSYNGKHNEVSDFNFGYITIDRYNTAFNDVAINTWSYLTTDIVQIGFWCRQDGDATTPIVLPSKDPFYLYRFGGECQDVKGMDVTDEWVAFDTMGSDGYENAWHPDGTVNPVCIFFVYGFFSHRPETT